MEKEEAWIRFGIPLWKGFLFRGTPIRMQNHQFTIRLYSCIKRIQKSNGTESHEGFGSNGFPFQTADL